MRAIVAGVILVFTASLKPESPRANFLWVRVTAPESAQVRVVWRPYAGAVGSRIETLLAANRVRRRVTDPDSLRRWQDPTARDTLVLIAPAEFVVDMTSGPFRIEAMHDSVNVEAQLTPTRGRLVSSWGKALVIDSDGASPSITRAR